MDMAWPNPRVFLVVMLLPLEPLVNQIFANANPIGIPESRGAETFAAWKAQDNEEIHVQALDAMKRGSGQSKKLQSEWGIPTHPQEECKTFKLGTDMNYIPKNEETAVRLVRRKQWRRLLRDLGRGRGEVKLSTNKVKEFEAENPWSNGQHQAEEKEVMDLQKYSDTSTDEHEEWQHNDHPKTGERRQDDSRDGRMPRNDEATTENPTVGLSSHQTNNYEEWKQKVRKVTSFHIAKAKVEGSDANKWGEKEETIKKEWNARIEADNANGNRKIDEVKWEAKEVKPETPDAKTESGSGIKNRQNHEDRLKFEGETKSMGDTKLERLEVKSESDNNNTSWRSDENTFEGNGEAKTEEPEHADKEWQNEEQEVAMGNFKVKVPQAGIYRRSDESENLKTEKHKVEEADDGRKLLQVQAEEYTPKDSSAGKEDTAEETKDPNLEMHDNKATDEEWKVQQPNEERANNVKYWQDKEVEEGKQIEDKKDTNNNAKPWQDANEVQRKDDPGQDNANDVKPWEDGRVQEWKQEDPGKDNANDAKPWNDENLQEMKQEKHEETNDVNSWQDQRVMELKEEDKKETFNDAKPFQDEAPKQEWSQEEQKENKFSVADPSQDDMTKDAQKQEHHTEKDQKNDNPFQGEPVKEVWKPEHQDNVDAKPWQGEATKDESKQEEQKEENSNDAKPSQDGATKDERKQQEHKDEYSIDPKPSEADAAKEWKEEEYKNVNPTDPKPSLVETTKEEWKQEEHKDANHNDAKPFQDEAAKDELKQEEHKDENSNDSKADTANEAWKEQETKDENVNDAKPSTDETRKEEWKQEETKDENVNDAKPSTHETEKEPWKEQETKDENVNDAQPSADETKKEEWKQEETKDENVNDAKPSTDETEKEAWKEQETKHENVNDAKPSTDETKREEWKQEETKDENFNDAKPSTDEAKKEEWKEEEHKDENSNDAKPFKDETAKEDWKQEDHQVENHKAAEPSNAKTTKEVWKDQEHKDENHNDAKPSNDKSAEGEWEPKEHNDETSNDAKPSKDESAEGERKQEEQKEDKVSDPNFFKDERTKEEWKEEDHKEDKFNDANPLQDKISKTEWTEERREAENKTVGWETNGQPKVSMPQSNGNDLQTKDIGVGSFEVQKQTEENGLNQRPRESTEESKEHYLGPDAEEPNSSKVRTEAHLKDTPFSNNDDIIQTAKADESLTSAENKDNSEKLMNEKDLLIDLADNQTQVTISSIEDSDPVIGVTAEPLDVEDYRDFIHEFSSLPSKFQETAGHVAHLLPEFHKLSEQSRNYFALANQQIAESFLPLVGKQYAPVVASLISYALLLLPLALTFYFFEHIRAIFALQKLLLCANVYLAGYFATLTMASFILTAEPMSFFQKYSPSSFISLMLLQVMAYLLYLLLEVINLFRTCSYGVAFPKLMACIQWLVATLVGLHYYVTVFHRAMARRPPQTSWRTYGIYSIAFLILCLLGRRTRHGKKQYFRNGDDITDKKN